MNYSNAFELLKSRRSIRRYTNRKVSRAMIEQVVEAACWAPSNHNRQGWKFIIFENREKIISLSKQVRQNLEKVIDASHKVAISHAEELLHYAGAFDAAPVVILVMHKKSPAMSRELLSSATNELASGEAISAAMAVENLLLMTHELELGACVMTAPLLAGEVWSSLPDLPLGFMPTCIVTLGYPSESPKMPSRKSIKHVIEYR